MLFFFFITCLLVQCYGRSQNVLMTEVFEIVVDPPMFNWTYEGRKGQFVYEATLLNAPDLPSWVHYVYSEKHHSAFLYGVPPNEKALKTLQIVGLNKQDYETRVENVNIIIQEKLNPARYAVHLKIDNLNVEDMFEVEQMEALKNIFRRHLWKDAEEDLYVTFLESAVEMGARKPLNPREGEGVVVRLGSEITFSSELLELQEEVRPLYKMQNNCPRDFKRTSVERFFRDAGFSLDWCSFKLIQKDENNNSAMHKSDKEKEDDNESNGDMWKPISRNIIPVRNYKREIITAIAFPLTMLLIMAILVTLMLCVDTEVLRHITEPTMISVNHHFLTDFPQKYCSNNQDDASIGKDTNVFPDLASNTKSPKSTINRGVHWRPSPPPYVRPKFKPQI